MPSVHKFFACTQSLPSRTAPQPTPGSGPGVFAPDGSWPGPALLLSASPVLRRWWS